MKIQNTQKREKQPIQSNIYIYNNTDIIDIEQ